MDGMSLSKKKVVFLPLWVNLIFVFCLSFVVFFWTNKGEIIDGNDTTYPLRPVEFFRQRLYQWNSSIGGGIDFSHGSAGLTWHGLQAAISSAGLPLWLSQKIFLLLFFNLISFSFYFFITRLTKSRAAAITGVVFYCFNSYLFNLWGNIQAASLSAYALIPLASGLFLHSLDNPRRKLLWTLTFGLSCLFFSAFGMNPAIIVVVFVYSVLFLIFTYLEKVIKVKNVTKKDYIQTVLLFISTFVIFNLFWLVPEIYSIFSKGYSLNVLSQDNRGWLDFVSVNTSMLNLLRQQGEWMWFALHKGTSYLPYAEIFKSNFLFIILGFLGLLASFSAILKSKNRWVVFFGAILIIGLLISVGSKPPFGYLYLLAAEKLKLLSILRAPWYKFGLLVSFSFAVLTVFFVDLFKNKKQMIVAAALCLFQLIYAFPLITGAVFPTNSALPFKFKVPDYVIKADEWLRNAPGDGGVVMLPRQGDLDYYHWGNSSSPFLNLLANPRTIFTEPSWTVLTDTGAGSLLKAFYDHLETGDSDQASNILNPLNVEYLLLKNDAEYNFDQDFGSPEFWRSKISYQIGLKKEKTFGEWEVYLPNNGNKNRLIYISNNISIVPAEPYLLADYFLLENKGIVVNNTKDVDLTGLSITYGGVGFPLEKIASFQPSPVYIRFSADHFLYPLIINKEEKTLSGLIDPLERINSLMVFSSKRLLEAEKIKNNNALLKKLLDNYFSNIVLVQKEFRNLPVEFNRKGIEALQTSLSRLSDQSERLNTMLLKNGSLIEINNAIAQNSQIAEEITRKLNILVSTETVKKYFIRVEKEGEYRGFILCSEISESLKTGQNWKIKVNQESLSVTTNKNDQSGVVIDNIPLKRGDNFIEINLPFPIEKNIPFVLIKKNDIDEISLPAPVTSYKKISPAKYDVEVKKAANSFVLVFSQNYHSNWQAKIVGEPNLIDRSKHIKVNGFANGWLIEKEGDFKVVLEYKTQKIYKFLLVLTSLLVCLAFIYFLVNIVKWKK